MGEVEGEAGWVDRELDCFGTHFEVGLGWGWDPLGLGGGGWLLGGGGGELVH